MVDRYLFGEVTRISPEAPVPIISVKREDERHGGAANVLNNIGSLGAKALGDFGSQKRTIVKTRLIAKGQQMTRIDFDYPQKPIEKLNLEGIRTVVFVDYGKGTLDNVQLLIQQAKKTGCMVLVDPKGYDYEKYRGADLVKPNLDEMRVMVGGWKDESDLADKVEKIKRDADIGAVLLTRGADGMTLYDHWAYRVYADAPVVVDVSGAGEAALSAFAVARHEGLDNFSATKYANKAAGIAVSRFGTTVVTKEEVFG